MTRSLSKIVAAVALIGLGSLASPNESAAAEGKLQYHSVVFFEWCSGPCSGAGCCTTPTM